MGQTTSSQVGQVATHAQAYQKTDYTRQVMDQLLNYMIKQLSVRDLLQMSKESECKKYVLFKANSIYQYFYELRIFPTKDAKGLLTFRKVEDLVNPKGEQEKERQSLCLIVAYFYTRIFQIYGALALTLIDDMNAMTTSGVMSLPQITDARLRTPGYYQQEAYYGKGGAKYEDDEDYFTPARRPRGYYEHEDPRRKEPLKNFEWIRSFLSSSEYEPEFGYKTLYSGDTSNRATIYLKINPTLKDMDDREISSSDPAVQSKQNGKFYIIIGSNKYSTLEVTTNKKIGESLKIRMSKLTYTNTFGETITVDQFNKLFSVKLVEGTNKYIVEGGSEDIGVSSYLNNYFIKIISYLKGAIKVHKDETNSTGTSVYARRSEEGITDHLKVEKMIEDLTKRKPLGHCIARALQLLKTQPLGNEAGVSQICSATFAENRRTGVVKKGETLSTSPGLFSLANLFYDTINIGSPNLTIGKTQVDGAKSSFDQYVEFMNKLAQQYEVDPKKTPEDYEKKGLDSIKDTRDQKECHVTTDIPLSLDATKKVNDVVKSMFQAQVDHAAECFKIISMLFNITYDKTTKKPTLIKLSDNLITKGFPELERINRLTRELLIKYYTNCEAKYLTGMKLVLDDQKSAANQEAKKQQNAIAQAAAKEAQQRAAIEKEKADIKATADVRVAELRRRADELKAAQKKTIDARQAAVAERKEQAARSKQQRDLTKLEKLEREIKDFEEQEARTQQAVQKATAAYKQAQAVEKEKQAALTKLREDTAAATKTREIQRQSQALTLQAAKQIKELNEYDKDYQKKRAAIENALVRRKEELERPLFKGTLVDQFRKEQASSAVPSI